MPLAAGQPRSHYRFLGLLGAGAMGEVRRARGTRLERDVAVEVSPEELAADWTAELDDEGARTARR